MPTNTEHNAHDISEAGGILTIDLAAIVANWRDLKRRAEPASCAAVVKADGYGCGLAPVTRALAQAGCETFFVAHLSEARSARAAAPRAKVYVLNGMLPGTAPAYAAANLMPVIGSHSELMEWRAFTAASGWRGGAALHIDTGMNRLGLSFEEATALAREPDALSGTTMLMSHLACAETPEHPLNAKQLAGFRELRAMFPGITASLANSSGIFLGPDAHHDLVRPGLALYGGNPTPEHLNPMQPVLELRGRIIQLRTVAKDETVGYGATFTTRRRTRLAVVSIGYADGLLRAASGRDDHAGAEAIVAGHPCPVAGAISMDLLALDVTDLPVGTPQRGDLVTFIGDGIGIDDLAARAGTIGYEILTSLGQRYVRRYTGS